MNAAALSRRIRAALTAAVGLLLFLWLASGVALVWLDASQVSGWTSAPQSFPPELAARNYSSPGGAIAQTPGAHDLRLTHFLSRPAYLVSGSQGYALFDAQNGEKLTPINEATAREIAKREFIGEGSVVEARLLDEGPHGYEGPTPVWRLVFSDARRTELFIPAETGQVAARRTRLSGLRDQLEAIHALGFGSEIGNQWTARALSAATVLAIFAIAGSWGWERRAARISNANRAD